jgi:hypothetical protein
MTRIRRTLLAAALGAGALAAPAAAQIPAVLAREGIGRLDPTPAASLLLPYFEVDLDDPGGVDTIVWLRNAVPQAALVHVTLWTDLAIPTLDFDIYLTGYDVQAFVLRDLFNGIVPATADADSDPSDVISPQGPLSGDITFPNCTSLPYPPLPASLINHIRASHTGNFSNIYGGCSGVDHGDLIARGFVTFDNVNACNLLFPSSPGYFGPGGVASQENVLWGDYYIVEPGNNLLFGDSLVHLEAAPGAFIPGDYTFYSRYVAFTGVDEREPLATTWAAGYATGGSWATDLICWRDAGTTPTGSGGTFSCGGLPTPYPLGHAEVLAFDEQEMVQDLSAAVACPWAAQRVAVGGPDLPVGFSFGWLSLDLNTSTGAPLDPIHQAYVAVISTNGIRQLGHHALPLDSALAPRNIFADGFESGDTSAWSATVP